MIHEAPGAGGEWLAEWAARLVLCTNPAAAPCGTCEGCRKAAASQHPDLIMIRPIEDSQQLRIEQVRELAAELALTSHQGGYKVGILTPADSLNRFAANALLKTLEEPPAKTLLILVATEPSRLPATILSRCQRIQVRAPSRSASIEWLRETQGEADWNVVLDVLGEAPLAAAAVDAKALPQLGSESRRALDDISAGAADPVSTAERWSRSELALRLRCFENWLTDRIRVESGIVAGAVEIRAPAHLPRPAAAPKLRGLFELMDGVRELKSVLDSPLNKSLALEGLLRRLAPAAKR
jgi:DNA polymerase-3 subunit delta'